MMLGSFASSPSKASAGGQELQPCDVNSSTTVGIAVEAALTGIDAAVSNSVTSCNKWRLKNMKIFTGDNFTEYGATDAVRLSAIESYMRKKIKIHVTVTEYNGEVIMKLSLNSLLYVLWITIAVSTTALAYTAPTDPAQVKPLNVGEQAPTFTVRTAKNDAYIFDAAKRSKPALVIFYRGGWCPYCNTQLASLRKVEPELVALGYEVLFMSTDRPALLYSSLKEKDIDYTLLSDSKMQAAEAFGVAFRMDDVAVARYKTYGIDLEATTGETHHELPVPSVFIIDKAGIIRYAHWNPDFKVRLSTDEILAAGRKAVGK